MKHSKLLVQAGFPTIKKVLDNYYKKHFAQITSVKSTFSESII